MFDNLKLFYNFKDFTIIRFDFKNYFDSISSEYVFKKSLMKYNFSKDESDLLQQYIEAVPFCNAGLALSNIFAEEMGRIFDYKVKMLIPNIIFYKRYVDDGILILNKIIDEKRIKYLLQLALDEIFFDKSIISKYKNKTKIENYMVYGGFEQAERKMFVFYPDKFNSIVVEKNLSNIVQIIRINLPDDLKGKYTHRDYLGGERV